MRPTATSTCSGVNADGSGLRQLTDGPFHDYYPCPLPDGGLAFISTRCKARFLCWRPQAFVLFRMDADGGNIRPLSFANLSEWAPSVMRDGRILWTRSEYLDKGADFGHTLWAIRPDGTHPELVFGNNTPNCYVNAPRGARHERAVLHADLARRRPQRPDRPDRSRAGAVSIPAAITNITPDSPPHYHMDWARQRVFPRSGADRARLLPRQPRPADRFGLYVIDRYGNRELLYLDPAIGSMCPTPLRPRPRRRCSRPAQPRRNEAGAGASSSWPTSTAGSEPAVPRGTVKYLRVCQEVRADLEQLPNGEYRKDHPPFQDFYASPTHLVRGPHGWPSYVAKAVAGPGAGRGGRLGALHAPAGKVLYFQALDEDLNEVQRMRSVVQLQPGEQRSCIGCHETARQRRAARPRRSPCASRRATRAAVLGRRAVLLREGRPAGVGRPVRALPRRRTTSRSSTSPARCGEDRVPASYRTLITQGWVHYFDMAWGREHTRPSR